MVRTHRVALALLAVLFVMAAVVVAGTRLLQAEPPPLPAAPLSRRRRQNLRSSEKPFTNRSSDTRMLSRSIIQAGELVEMVLHVCRPGTPS